MNRLSIRFTAIGGSGGKGAIAYRRIKNNDKAGPSGGCGGNGGHVILRGDKSAKNLIQIKQRIIQDKNMSLLDLSSIHDDSLIKKCIIQAECGENGRSNRGQGKSGLDCIINIPQKCTIKDLSTNKILKENLDHDQLIVIARGGLGGQGNSLMRNSVEQCPRYAQIGAKGQMRYVEIQTSIE